MYSSRAKKLNFGVKLIISQQCIFLLEQEEIIFDSQIKRIPFASNGVFCACSIAEKYFLKTNNYLFYRKILPGKVHLNKEK